MNTIEYPRKMRKSDVRKELGADGFDRKAEWNYGEYTIWFMHISKQSATSSSFWKSTAENGRINLMYQDKEKAVIIEIRGQGEHRPAPQKPYLVFASDDEGSEYEFKGVFKCMDTDDNVIDHVFERISTGFDIDNKKPL